MVMMDLNLVRGPDAKPLRIYLFLHLNLEFVGAPQMTSKPVSSNYLRSQVPSETRENSKSVHFLILSSHFLLLSALSSFHFYCALQDGFGQT